MSLRTEGKLDGLRNHVEYAVKDCDGSILFETDKFDVAKGFIAGWNSAHTNADIELCYAGMGALISPQRSVSFWRHIAEGWFVPSGRL